MKIALPFKRSARSAGDHAASLVVSEGGPTLARVDAEGPAAVENLEPDAAAAVRAADNAYFRMLCLAFVAMSG